MLKLKDGMELGKLNVLGDSSFSSKPKVNGTDVALSNEIPTVNNATLTIQKNGTNVGTFTSNASSNSTINITVPTGTASEKNVVTTVDASANLPTSNAVKTFVEGKGYLTGITSSQVTDALGYTPYNSTNPNGYLTSSSNLKEANLVWGEKSISGSISPLDTACSSIHSANRFAFANPAGITIEYSTNGSTYSTYSTTDSAKINLVSGVGQSYLIGARATSTTVNDKLRVTLNATNMGIYTNLRKLLINISTNYAKGSNVVIEKSMKGSETTFTTIGTYPLSGWSGWNSIPIGNTFGGGSTQTWNIAILRLTFGITGVTSGQTSNALQLLDIIGIGDTYWAYNSNMARTGHLYDYDSAQNATFPAGVTATTFTGSLSGNATSATNATKLNNQDASYYLNYNNFTNKPTIPTVNNGTLSFTRKNSQVGSFTANQSFDTTLQLSPTHIQLFWYGGTYQNTTGNIGLGGYSYKSFSDILIVWGSEGFGCNTTTLIPVSLIEKMATESNKISKKIGMNFSGTSTLRQTYGYFSNETTFYLEKAENAGVKAIYGIY